MPENRNVRTVQKGRRTINLMNVAKVQRWLVLCVAAYVMVYGTLIVTTLGGGQGAISPTMFMGIQVLGVILTLVIGITSIVCVGMLASALGTPVWLLVIGILLMFAPCINLLLLLSINSRATRILKKHGIKIGFLGVPESEYPKLYLNACPGCGYDLDGNTTGLCPECGQGIVCAAVSEAHP